MLFSPILFGEILNLVQSADSPEIQLEITLLLLPSTARTSSGVAARRRAPSNAARASPRACEAALAAARASSDDCEAAPAVASLAGVEKGVRERAREREREIQESKRERELGFVLSSFSANEERRRRSCKKIWERS